ncbi:13163_t:CDS:2, partial [Acaulospora colombiana]
GTGSEADFAQYSLATLERLALDCENTANEVQRRVGMLGASKLDFNSKPMLLMMQFLGRSTMEKSRRILLRTS